MIKRSAKSAISSFVPSPARATGFLQRKCACGQHAAGGDCEECRKEKGGSSAGYTIQRKGLIDKPAGSVPEIVGEVLHSPGVALDATTRSYFESRLGQKTPINSMHAVTTSDPGGLQIGAVNSEYEREADMVANEMVSKWNKRSPLKAARQAPSYDLSRIRVHTDRRAAESASAVNALAYTVRDHIVFGDGQFDPTSKAGRHLLAHELTHVAQQGAAGSLLQRVPDTGPLDLPQQDECEKRADITKEFQDFIKDLPGLLKEAQEFTAEQKISFKTELDRVFSREAGVDVSKYHVISCDVIHSDLLLGGETALAQVDSDKKEIRLSRGTKQLMDDFRKSKSKTSLLNLIQTLAHEKRHVTLGGALKARPEEVLPGRPPEVAKKATYRAEEILATAEEIAVGRMAVGESYAVAVSKQEKLRRQNNMIRNYVSEAEYKRLRSIIIAKLRERYGFDKGCDNQLTLGVLTSMDRNRWFNCDTSGPGAKLVTPVPDGLNICPGSRICPQDKDPSSLKTTENEEGTAKPEWNVVPMP